MKIDAFRLRHLAECVENQSQDPKALEEVFRQTGLSQEAISPTQTVDAITEPKFVNAACDVLADPAFGAKAGLLFRCGTNLNSYIAKYSHTLRDAIKNSGRYYSIFDPAFSYSLWVSGNSASFKMVCENPEFEQFHRYKEFLLFTALSRGRSLTGADYRPLEMRLDHDVKSTANEIQKLAGCTVVFGSETLELMLPLTVLDLNIPTYDPSLQNHLMEYGEKLLEDRPTLDQSLKVKIKGILTNNLPGHITSANDVASDLGMSKRTFARRLTDEGVSFRKIVDEVRHDLARVYLKDSFSLSEIAFSLDYADQAAFSTAFRRWEGCSPSDYRTSQT